MTNPTAYADTVVKHPRIHDVKTKALRLIPDERGFATYPGVVKAWHYHTKQVDHFVCAAGMVKLVLVDTRADSPTKGAVNEFFLGTQNPTLVQVPNLVYHGGSASAARCRWW